jgi:hypothetical protein
MGDRKRGIYQKFEVTRTDGSSVAGGKHEGCAYFVLDLDHDDYALPALAAYADACERKFSMLAADLREVIRSYPCACEETACPHNLYGSLPASPSEMLQQLMDSDD